MQQSLQYLLYEMRIRMDAGIFRNLYSGVTQYSTEYGIALATVLLQYSSKYLLPNPNTYFGHEASHEP
jgi:hypothetical protein